MGCCDYVYETRDKVTHWDPLKTVRDAGDRLTHSDPLKDVRQLSKWNPLHDIEDFIYDNRGIILGFVIGGPVGGLIALVDKDAANEINDVVTGRYADRQKHMQESKNKYDDKVSEYKKAMGALQDEYVIDDEIFKLAAANEAKRVQDKYLDEIKVLLADLNKQIEDFNQDFKRFQAALDHKYFKYITWMPLVIGGLVNDAKDFLTKGDWEAGRRLLSTTLEVIGILITIVLLTASLVADAATGGATSFLTVMLITSLIAQITLLVIQLDSAYAQGTLMNGVFSVLDFILNEILHLDDVWSELGTHKLSDPKYYQELTGYIQTIAAITALVTSIASLNCEGYAEVAKSASATLPAGISEYTTITSSMPYKVLSTTYNAYKLYGDSRRAEEALEALKEKSKNDIDKIHSKMERNRRRKMMESYRAEEQILTGTSNIVSEYAMSAFASPTSSFDPEMTIAANYGYEHSGDNVMDFVPEFTIDYNSLAGGSKYVNKILYKI